MTGLLVSMVDLVLPRECAGCGRAGALLCAGCLPRAGPVTVACGGLPVLVAGRYDGGLRRAIVRYKERDRRELAGLLGAALGTAVAALTAADGSAVLVPVPSSSRAARERGGDHVLRLARHAARRTAMPVVPALSLARRVRDSAGLHRDERAANLAGAMRAVGPAGAGAAVIVDDIVTTGATLREAARALRGAGWTILGGAAVAATPRRAGPAGRDAEGGLP
jgi:predicted amidophosphoribosyltransferase